MSLYSGDVMCLVLPYVDHSVSTTTIFNIFKNLGWGYISEVSDCRTKYTNKVFIHFSIWNPDFEYKRKFFQKDPSNHTRVYYNNKKNLYWNVSEARGFRNWRHKFLGIEDEFNKFHGIIVRPQRANSIEDYDSMNYYNNNDTTMHTDDNESMMYTYVCG